MRRSRKPVWAVSSIEGSNPSLSVSRQVRAIVSHAHLRIACRYWRFRLQFRHDFPTSVPLGHPGSRTAWPRSSAGLETGESASFERDKAEIPRRCWKASHANGHLPGPAGGFGGLTSPQLPQLLPGAGLRAVLRRRTSPQDRRIALPPVWLPLSAATDNRTDALSLGTRASFWSDVQLALRRCRARQRRCLGSVTELMAARSSLQRASCKSWCASLRP
jgi:hypothetical protein